MVSEDNSIEKGVNKKMTTTLAENKLVSGVWSKEEIELLKTNLPNKGVEEIAAMLGRTLAAVNNKVYKMGLNERKYPCWTDEQVKELAELFPHTTTIALANKLGRSINAVREKAQRMGLKKAADHLQALGRKKINREII